MLFSIHTASILRLVVKKPNLVASVFPALRFSTESGFGTWDGKINKRVEERIDLLDVGVTSGKNRGQSQNLDLPKASHQVKDRLNRPLIKPEKKVISSAQMGALEATAEDLREVLLDALSSSSFHNLFKGTNDASQVINFLEVKLNADCSHATVMWRSPVIEQFAKLVLQRQGEQKALKFNRSALKYINKKLAGRESQFRSIVIRNMHFRRVPRIFFEPVDSDMGLLTTGMGKERDMRQEVLRREGDNVD